MTVGDVVAKIHNLEDTAAALVNFNQNEHWLVIDEAVEAIEDYIKMLKCMPVK